MEAGDEEDGLERQLVGLDVGAGRSGRCEEVGETLDGQSGIGRLCFGSMTLVSSLTFAAYILRRRPLRETHVGGINGEGQDVCARQGLDGGLVLDRIAHDEDDEAAPLHVERQRLGQRQPGRAGNDNDLGAAAILAALGPPDLAHVLVLLVALVGDGAGDDDGGADEVLVAREPALQLLERRQRHDDDLGLGRGQRLDNVGQPVDGGQALADGLGRLVDALVDEVGGVVRDAPEVARDGGQLKEVGES